jgi:hypothetical protein
LAVTWCVDTGNERNKELTEAIARNSDNDLVQVIKNSINKSEKIIGDARGPVNNLTAEEALDKVGS